MNEFQNGGIIATVMPPRGFRTIFQKGLYIYQKKLLTKLELTKAEIEFGASWEHVRYCTRQEIGEFFSQSYPRAKYDFWRPGQVDGSRFIYYPPKVMTPSDIEMREIRFYFSLQVRDPKGRYDWLQLGSYYLNYPIWIIWESQWGRERIRILNLAGGREVCSSAVWAAMVYIKMIEDSKYDNAMVSPALFYYHAIKKNYWEVSE